VRRAGRARGGRGIGPCVTNVLTEADRLAAEDSSVRTVLVPLLGTGVAGADVPRTARELVSAAVEYLTGTPGCRLRSISFLAFTGTELVALERAIGAHPNLVRI
jgi:O-acetyl-ADP-ribose deacetylase (regulator of RNase III)